MDAKQLRIAYMGTPDFAVAPLRYLHEHGYNIVAVVTAADKPAGRGMQLRESAVKRYACSVGLPVMQPEKLRDPQFVEEFKSLEIDLGIVIAFRMLPEIIWAMPKLGTFNLHASLLPQYRGAAPINWAIINGETKTGVTTFMLNSEIDKGAIIGQKQIEITDTDNAETLHDKLMEVGVGLVVETVEVIASGEVEPLDQNKTAQNLPLREAPKIFRNDCKVDWSKTTKQIYDFVRGLSPYPGAWSEIDFEDGKAPVQAKIQTITVSAQDQNMGIGSIETDNKSYLRVRCADGWMELEQIQLAGKKSMTVEEFLRGARLKNNAKFM